MWSDGSFSGGTAWNGTFNRADDSVCDRYGRNKNRLDLLGFSKVSFAGYSVYFVSGIMDYYDRDAGDLLLFCEETDD